MEAVALGSRWEGDVPPFPLIWNRVKEEMWEKGSLSRLAHQ